MPEEVDEKQPWWMKAVTTLGIPTVFLGVLLYMVWQAGVWAATEVVHPIVDKQVKMIDDVSGMVKTMDTAVGEINRTLKAHGEHAIESLKISNDSKTAALSNSARLDLMQERMTTNTKNMVDVLNKIEENTSPIKTLKKDDMK